MSQFCLVFQMMLMREIGRFKISGAVLDVVFPETLLSIDPTTDFLGMLGLRCATNNVFRNVAKLQNCINNTTKNNSNVAKDMEGHQQYLQKQTSWIVCFFVLFGTPSMFFASLELICVICLVQFYSFAIILLQLLISTSKTRFSLLLGRWLEGADWLDLMIPWPWLQKLIKSMPEVSI